MERKYLVESTRGFSKIFYDLLTAREAYLELTQSEDFVELCAIEMDGTKKVIAQSW